MRKHRLPHGRLGCPFAEVAIPRCTDSGYPGVHHPCHGIGHAAAGVGGHQVDGDSSAGYPNTCSTGVNRPTNLMTAAGIKAPLYDRFFDFIFGWGVWTKDGSFRPSDYKCRLVPSASVAPAESFPTGSFISSPPVRVAQASALLNSRTVISGQIPTLPWKPR